MTMTIIPKKQEVKVLEDGTIVKKRVAAYARVSTDLEDQCNSYEAQLSEYEARIKENPDWEFVELYSDKGISGTSLKHRDGFNRMIKHALQGKIDLILVKSISRFARNTVDCVSIYRQLKNANVGIYFDKEHINSLEKDVEFQLTLYASMAQEESKSISQNVKWGVRSRMRRGERKMNIKHTLGYEYLDGKIVINEEEAITVRCIYSLYIGGLNLTEIASELKNRGYKKKDCKTEWGYYDVYKILKDEKYIGRFVMQKTVVKDFLDHKAYKNDGIEEKYIFDNHHPAIIKKDNFDYVQTVLSSKDLREKEKGDINPLHDLAFCSECFLPLKKLTHHPRTAYARDVLTCRIINKNNIYYTSCSHAHGPVDFSLAMIALKEIILKFAVKDMGFDNLFMQNIENSIAEIYEEKVAISQEINRLRKELQGIITSTISNSKENNSVLFNRISKDLNNEKVKMEDLNKQEIELKELAQCYHSVEEVLNNKTVSYRLAHKVIKLVVRKPDGSLRFVMGKEAIKGCQKVIQEALLLEPIYSSSVTDGKRTLNFDVAVQEVKEDAN